MVDSRRAFPRGEMHELWGGDGDGEAKQGIIRIIRENLIAKSSMDG